MHPLPETPTPPAPPRLDATSRVASPPVPVPPASSTRPASPTNPTSGQAGHRSPVLLARGERLSRWVRDAEEQARVIRERAAAERLRQAHLEQLGRLANAD